MKSLLSKVLSFWDYSILRSVVFNIRHLPFRQAWKLPI